MKIKSYSVAKECASVMDTLHVGDMFVTTDDANTVYIVRTRGLYGITASTLNGGERNLTVYGFDSSKQVLPIFNIEFVKEM